MSVFQVTQVKGQLHRLFDSLIDVYDVPEGQSENSFLSRALAAYGLVQLAGADASVAAAAITDGFNDNGIDAIYHDPRERRLFVVQSKWIHSGNGEPDLGDVNKFSAGVKDLLNLRFDRFNEKVRLQQDLVMEISKDPATKVTAVLAYTSTKRELAEHGSRVLDDLVAEVNEGGELLDPIVLWPLPMIHQTLSALAAGKPINLEVGVKSWGKVAEPVLAYYGQVSANEVAGWWKEHEQRLFAKNLRGVLGETDVNAEIRRTLGTEPHHFWYFNNGITIVAKKVQKTLVGGGENAFGTFHCTDASVVNGAQTVSTVGTYAARTGKLLEGVYLQVRLISLESAPETFGEVVTRTNNRQNEIQSRDFATLDPEQTRIRSELAVDGVQYHVERTSTPFRGESSFGLVEATHALACASLDTDITVLSKREIGRLWEDIEKPPYRTLFNSNTRGYYVWRCVQLHRKVERYLDDVRKGKGFEGRDYGIAVHGNRLIAMLVFERLQSYRLKDFQNDLDGIATDDVERETLAAFEAVKREVERQYPNAIIPTLFKNASKCQSIVKAIRQPQVAF